MWANEFFILACKFEVNPLESLFTTKEQLVLM